ARRRGRTGLPRQCRADVVRGVLDPAMAPEVVVQGALQILSLEAKEYVDARRLDVRVHDRDAPAVERQGGGEVGREVRFPRPAAERVHRYDPGHACSIASGSDVAPRRWRRRCARCWSRRKWSVSVISATSRAFRASSISTRSCWICSRSPCSRVYDSMATAANEASASTVGCSAGSNGITWPVSRSSALRSWITPITRSGPRLSGTVRNEVQR